MNMIKKILPFVVGLLLLSLNAETRADDIMSVRLLSDKKSMLPGDTITLGIEISMKKGWHTYWINPGDAGLPLRFEWSLPEGFKLGNIRWPIPELSIEEGIASLIYKGKIVIPVMLNTPLNFKGSKATLGLSVKALVCDEKCIPSSGNAKLTIPVNYKKSLQNATFIKLLKYQDGRFPESYPLAEIKASRDTKLIRIDIPMNELIGPNDRIEFYPYQEGIYNLAAGQETKFDGKYYSIVLRLDELRAEEPSSVSGVLINSSGWKNLGFRKAMEINLNLIK